jgi:spore coat polysaccharide biosynthesis predicted glycosyltransferase SpsG
MKKIQIIFHDAGGGHRNAAVALQAMAKAQNRDWEVELIQFQELTDRLDVLRKVTGIRIQEQYNTLLRNGWTLGSEYLLRVLQWTIRIFHGPLVKLLKSFWRTHPADMLISVIPHFNREIAESWERVYPGRPFVTVITDLADFPPRFWIEPVKEQFVIAGTERAVEQARAMGKDAAHVFGVSGMVLRPEFYQESSVDPAAVKKELGLREDLPSAMVLFGGFGSKVMYEIVEKLDAARLPVQLILICGKNEKLAARLKAKKWNVGTSVIGFTKEVHKLMRAADFLIGKPGPGSIAEAMQRGLPVLVECNAWTLPQERFNAEWVTEKRVGVVLKSFDDVVSGVRQMLEPAKLAEFRKNVAAQNNRAIFEIMEILERMLAPESAQTEKEIAAAPVSVR